MGGGPLAATILVQPQTQASLRPTRSQPVAVERRAGRKSRVPCGSHVLVPTQPLDIKAALKNSMSEKPASHRVALSCGRYRIGRLSLNPAIGSFLSGRRAPQGQPRTRRSVLATGPSWGSWSGSCGTRPRAERRALVGNAPQPRSGAARARAGRAAPEDRRPCRTDLRVHLGKTPDLETAPGNKDQGITVQGTRSAGSRPSTGNLRVSPGPSPMRRDMPDDAARVRHKGPTSRQARHALLLACPRSGPEPWSCHGGEIRDRARWARPPETRKASIPMSIRRSNRPVKLYPPAPARRHLRACGARHISDREFVEGASLQGPR